MDRRSRIVRGITFLMAFHSALLVAEPSITPREEVLDFLTQHVMGKTLYVKSSGLDTDSQGKPYQWDLERRWTFTNLNRTTKGFSFDALINIVHTRFSMNDNMRVLPGVRLDRQMVLHFAAGELNSFYSLVGVATMQVSTIRQDPTGIAYTLRMKMSDGRLIMDYSTPLVEEFLDGTTGQWRPQSCDHHEVLMLVNGILERDWQESCFRVDSQTWKRTEPAGEPYIVHEKIL